MGNRFDLPGVNIDVKPRRQYINRFGGAHLIGYLSEINSAELSSGRHPDFRSGDLIGKSGVEKIFDRFLRGKRGGRQIEVDASGRMVKVLKQVDADPGHNIILSIDHRLQQKAESLLNHRAGSVVALDPQSGYILALASSPTFDPNAFITGISHKDWNLIVSNPFRPLENKATQALYPPASTYKIITAIAGLEEGVVNTHTTFFCPGFYRFGNRSYRCWKKWGHGRIKIERALIESCDVFFYQVGQRLGVDRLAKYAKKFGLGSFTGVDLDAEANGLIPTAAWKKRRFGVSWQKGETLSVSIGQGFNLVTPLQLAVMMATVANGGVRYKPMIAKSIEAANGQVIQRFSPTVLDRIKISKATLDIVRTALWKAVNTRKGTAWKSRLDGMDMSGKTGTAQVIGRKKGETEEDEKNRPDHFKPHALFVAYAPAKNPEIAVSVIIEHGEHGSSTAAPIARDMIKTYLEMKKGDGARSVNSRGKQEAIDKGSSPKE
jgi:penicillin-binding protein 2